MKLLENVELEQLSYTFGEHAKDCCIDVRFVVNYIYERPSSIDKRGAVLFLF